jgi:hypothetical protein
MLIQGYFAICPGKPPIFILAKYRDMSVIRASRDLLTKKLESICLANAHKTTLIK